MGARFYTDVQARLSPASADPVGLAVGVNNLFKTKAPGCFSCGLNNFDPTAYDVPGRYFYARAIREDVGPTACQCQG